MSASNGRSVSLLMPPVTSDAAVKAQWYVDRCEELRREANADCAAILDAARRTIHYSAIVLFRDVSDRPFMRIAGAPETRCFVGAYDLYRKLWHVEFDRRFLLRPLGGSRGDH